MTFLELETCFMPLTCTHVHIKVNYTVGLPKNFAFLANFNKAFNCTLNS